MKKTVFAFLLGVVLTGSIAGVVAYNYNAKDVSYTPNDNNWNVNNVEDAIKDLREIQSKKTIFPPDNIIRGINSTHIDDDYSTCILAVARASSDNQIIYNGNNITPQYKYHQSDGGNTIIMHTFYNLKNGDVITYQANGVTFCWK